MNITFIIDTFGGGGKERRCLQLIQGLNKRGYKNIQVIILNNDIAYPELYNCDINLHIIDRKNKGLNFFQTIKVLYGLLKDYNPDVVQVWSLFSTIYTNIIRCFYSFKYIGAYVADCNKPSKFSVWSLTLYLNTILSDYIVGNSIAGIKAYNIPHAKAKVIYNGFNEERLICKDFETDTLKKETNINTQYVVAMIARIDENKDHATFVNAARKILKDYHNYTFICVGDGPLQKSYMSELSELESKKIHFLGFRSDIEKILKITDISVLCTNPKKHKEGVSNSILESLAFGVPVIATNDGGSPEIIQQGVNGYLIAEFDSNDLADKIIQITGDNELYKKLSISACEIIRDKFSLSIMTNSYEQMYLSLMKS
ncbi:glycosyltransferase [Flavobacterium sp.]|uniref:glycosyltransferase n=1 Tax=Flavobacterium sp. TaxID=239 RepID=UPI0037513104